MSQRRHGKDIFLEIYLRRLKDVTQKTSFLRCFWEVLKTWQKRHLLWDVSERCLRYVSQWRSDWDLSETSRAGWELSFDQDNHPKLLFGDNFPKQIKNISEINKLNWELQLSKSHLLLVVSYQLPLTNPHKKKSVLFLWGQEFIKGKTSAHAESVAPIPSKLQKRPEPMVPIQQQEL